MDISSKDFCQSPSTKWSTLLPPMAHLHICARKHAVIKADAIRCRVANSRANRGRQFSSGRNRPAARSIHGSASSANCQREAEIRSAPVSDHCRTSSANGLIPGSERYAFGPLALQKYLPVGSGDWIGFSQGAEAVLARYRKGGEEVTILIAEYPTQQIAAKRFDAMTPVVHPIRRPPLNETRVVGSLREADLIGLAIAPKSGEFPDGLLKQVNFGHYVTSNEGKFKATEPSMPVYIVGAFVGAGAIMLMAIFSGLGFAVVRIVVKKFFPEKFSTAERPWKLSNWDFLSAPWI